LVLCMDISPGVGPQLLAADGDSDLSQESPSNAVLLRCRDTIERLHGEVEQERIRRREIQQKAISFESELQAVQAELEVERSQRLQGEARITRFERQLADSDAKLQVQRQSRDTLVEQLQAVKQDVVQKGQAHFSSSLRVAELEREIKRAELRAASAQDDSKLAAQELRSAAEEVSARDLEAAQIKAKLAAQASRALHAERLVNERDRQVEDLQRELEDLQAALQELEEMHVKQLAEVQDGHERLSNACREREADLCRSLAEAAEHEESSLHVSSEAAQLQKHLAEVEATSAQLEFQVAQLEQGLVASETEYKEALEELSSHSHELAQLRHETETGQLLRQQAASSASSEVHLMEMTQARASEASTELRAESELARRLAAFEGELEGELEESRDALRLEEARHRDEEEVAARAQATVLKLEQAATRTEEELQLQYREVAVLREATEQARRTAAEAKREAQQFGEARCEADARTTAAEARAASVLSLEATLEAEASTRASEACAHAKALSRGLMESRAKMFRMEAELTLEIRSQESAAGKANEAETKFLRAEAKTLEEMATVSSAVHLEVDWRAKRLRNKYEQKLAKMSKQLSARQAYEGRLKAIIEAEADVLHEYNRELDGCCNRRMRRYD